MDTETETMDNTPRKGRESRPKSTSIPYAIIAVVAGTAFALTALLHAPGITYAVVAVLAGACYTVAGMAGRGRR
jgi:hypothetical protein